MGFLDIGTGELVLILVIVLIVMGPGKIVEAGRTLGKMVRSLRKATSDLTTAVTKEIEGDGKDSPPSSDKTIK